MSIQLSIIIPVFKAERYLSRCLDSVLQCNLKEIEVIVIDDASTSECHKIVQQYQQYNIRVRYFRHEFNKGLFSARYTGIKHAQGEYLVHLDPDDWVEKTVYSNALKRIKETNSDVILFNVEQCDETGRKWTEPQNTIPEFTNKEGSYLIEQILLMRSTAWIWHVNWNKLIKSSLAKKLLNNFNSDKHLIMNEDLLWSMGLYLELKNTSSISSIEQVGITYYRHKDAITQNQSLTLKKINDIWYVFTQLEQLMKKHHFFRQNKKSFISTKSYVLNIYLHLAPKYFILKKLGLYIKIITFFLFKSHSKIQNKKLNIITASKILTEKIVRKKTPHIAIFGTGELSLLLLKQMKKKNIDVVCFIVSKKTTGTSFHGLPLFDINEAIQEDINQIIIGSIGSCYYIDNILKNVISKYNKKIITTLVFD